MSRVACRMMVLIFISRELCLGVCPGQVEFGGGGLNQVDGV